MAQIVEFKGQRIEFPDGMPPQEIEATLKQNAMTLFQSKFDAPSKKSATDIPNAIGTGYFQGLTRLAGLPVDTVANVIDLGKAAIGAPYTAITGKPAPDWLQVGSRADVFGSGENLLNRARATTPGKVMLQAANPEYEGGYWQMAGGGLNGVMSPQSGAQAINQAVNSVAGSLLGKATYDATGSTALAIAAGMSPTAGRSLLIDGTKRAVRGGEKGRREMEQRIQDLKDAGIDSPTLGLASGNKLIGGTENLLQSTPGAVRIMQRNRDAALAGIEGKVNAAADAASTNRGAIESGRSIQAGGKAFRDNFKATQTGLYNRLSNHIPEQSPVDVSNTRNTLAALNADIPTMPELSKQFKNSRIQSIQRALDSDMSGTPAVPASSKIKYFIDTISDVDANGVPVLRNVKVPIIQDTPEVPAVPARTAIPFEAVKKTRTLVGGEIADSGLLSDVPRSKWNPLYGALSSDMGAAANAAGPAAERTFARANNYTRSGIKRLERIEPVIDRTAPEQSFSALNQTLKENTSTFQAVKKSLPEGARGDFAGTVIERLGKATPGQQDSNGGKWSPETFLTNWNKISQRGKDELLSGFPNSAQVKSDVEAAAKATAMMRDNSKMWANPSGTGTVTAARGVLGSIGLGGVGSLLGLVNPSVPIVAGGAVGGANLLARALTNPGVVKSMASQSYVDPQMQGALLRTLAGGGLLGEGNY